MPKYAFLFIDPGDDYLVHTREHAEHSDAALSAERERVYAEIFRWFKTNGPRIADGGAELQPTSTATTVRKTGGRSTVVDGPFVEAKESIGGLTVFDLPDRAAAVELAKTWPGYAVEIRPIVEMR